MSEDTVTVYPVAYKETVQSMPALSLRDSVERRKELVDVTQSLLRENIHFMVLSKDKKPSLLKPGAEILAQFYGLSEEFEIHKEVEQWDARPPLFDYTIKCIVRSKRDNSKLSEQYGSCNSWESKYKYRDAQRSCPSCGRPAIIKGKEEYGGGWLCWNKNPELCCKTKFAITDKAITDQAIGKIDNPDIADVKNTILKMAQKRAYVGAIILATGASELYTQDLEDLPFDVEIIKKGDDKPTPQEEAQAQPEDPNRPVTKDELNALVKLAKERNWAVPDDLNAYLNKYYLENKLPQDPTVRYGVWKMTVNYVNANPKK